MRAIFLTALTLLVACDQPAAIQDCEDCVGDERVAEGSEDLLDAPQSQCGNVWYVDMTVVGQLTGPDVWLEERAWMPTSIHGEGVTDDEGRFSFDVVEVPIVEECWGWAALFSVVGEHADASGEIDANMQIVRGWQDGTNIADVSKLPFVLER
jgi:hypothetical protein